MKTWVKIILGVLFLGIGAIAWVYVFVYNKSHPDYENMKPDYTLAASVLYDSFKANTAGSSMKYNGKVLVVSGTLTNVESNDSVVIAVFVFNQGLFGSEGIRCTMLPKFNEEAKRLRRNNVYTLKGYCAGYNDPDVILEQCSVIK